MSNIGYFTAVWYTDYVGIGYIRNNEGWHVFPIFSNSSEAKRIWDKQIEPLDERNLRMRFVEYNAEYKFILYSFPFSKEKTNFGFYRSLGSSDTYSVFKKNFNGQAYFTFGIFVGDSTPTIYHKSKLVTDIKFMKSNEVKENSIEWIAEEVQKRMRTKYGN